MLRLQVWVAPVHAPLQPLKIDSLPALAVSVTGVPSGYGSVQSDPQEIPAGLLVTAPDPSPDRATDKVTVPTLKVAVTVFAASIITVHVASVPVHAPLQPVNVAPVAGVAVSTTEVPAVKSSLQSAPQAMPEGALVTVPLPVPAFVTCSATVETVAPF
jgi:hypothetical protein